MKLYKRNKLVNGVGINDADYNVTKYKYDMVNGKKKRVCSWRCPYYIRWYDMLVRCYSERYQSKRPTYIGCTVCTEWLVFSVFKSWMESQDWEGNQLDKDLIVKGNKAYNPSACAFVPPSINLLMNENAAKRGEYPMGVYKQGHRFRSGLRLKGKRIYLGTFDTPEEAFESYENAKSAYILDVIEQHPTLDSRVKQSLTAIAEEMSSYGYEKTK